jgi:hypothetical protein
LIIDELIQLWHGCICGDIFRDSATATLGCFAKNLVSLMCFMLRSLEQWWLLILLIPKVGTLYQSIEIREKRLSVNPLLFTWNEVQMKLYIQVRDEHHN